MEEQKKLGTTYKMLRALGFNYSEEAYGDVIAAYQSSWSASMDIEAFGMQSRQGVFHR